MSKTKVSERVARERGRDLNAELRAAIGDAREGRYARKTEFKPLSDGRLRRRVVRADGTVEKDEIIPASRLTVAAARAGTGLSQSDFAKALGVSVRTLQDWEQGRRAPSGAARTLLSIAARHPRILKEAAQG